MLRIKIFVLIILLNFNLVSGQVIKIDSIKKDTIITTKQVKNNHDKPVDNWKVYPAILIGFLGAIRLLKLIPFKSQ